MLGIIGVLLGYIGFAAYFPAHWRSSEDMVMGKRMIVGMLGFPTAFYGTLIFVLSTLYGFDMGAVGVSLFLMGIAFMSVNLGRVFPIATVDKVLSKDMRAFGKSIVHVVLFEVNSMYVLLIAILGTTMMYEEHLPCQVFNTASVYVSLGAAAAAILMGIIMRKMLEDVNTFEELSGKMLRTLTMTIVGHAVAIIGLLLAIMELLPYME